MRRADRLFDIVQFLRRKQVARAADIAQALDVSRWTIYRDIRALRESGVPIDGEVGTGYLLRPGFDLPPLMFSRHEISALLLGARMVESWADAELADAARDIIAKVRGVMPDGERSMLDDVTLLAPANHESEAIQIDQVALRHAIHRQVWVEFDYRDASARTTRRRVRPLLMAFYGPIWLLAAWCELRCDFRIFRLDRMAELTVFDERFPAEAGKTAADFLKQDAEYNKLPSSI